MKRKGLYINKLQFYWRLKKRFDDKNVVPDFLPFESDYHQELKLIIQKRNKKTLEHLNKVYQEDFNIGNIQDDSQWSKLYGEDFLSFLNFSRSKETQKIKSILEIGCGGGILLKVLKDEGYRVLGVDPSPFAVKEGEERGVRVIKDFFPTKEVKSKFDLIFHSDVLEHVVDPVGFLRAQRSCLNENGMVVISVPDCTESIANGDISIFLHQHLSYFDKESLKNTVMTAGFKNIHFEKAKFGGSLYCVAKKTNDLSRPRLLLPDCKEVKYRHFLKNYLGIKSRLIDYIKKILGDGDRTLGFYAPVRALSYLGVMGLYKGFRFFDDTSPWHNRYFDGIPIPIENFSDLRKNPVTDLIVMSPTFGNIIEEKVTRSIPDIIDIKKLKDFFNA